MVRPAARSHSHTRGKVHGKFGGNTRGKPRGNSRDKYCNNTRVEPRGMSSGKPCGKIRGKAQWEQDERWASDGS